jgi:hypothetical protein
MCGEHCRTRPGSLSPNARVCSDVAERTELRVYSAILLSALSKMKRVRS